MIRMAYKRITKIIEMAWPKDDTHERQKWCDDDHDGGGHHHTEFHYDLFVIAGIVGTTRIMCQVVAIDVNFH